MRFLFSLRRVVGMAVAFMAGIAPLAHAQTGSPYGLPLEVTAALARASVPSSAISVRVTPIPSATTTALVPPRLSHRAEEPMNPASVMKLVTTYAGIDLLGPQFAWQNRVYIDQPPVNGVLAGNLYLRGSGDPKLVLERIQDWFAQIQALGVREVRGDIVLDRSVFNVRERSAAEFDDDPLRPYNAQPDGLLVNFKSLIFTLVPQADGLRAAVVTEPPIDGVELPTDVPLVSGACGDWRSGLRANFANPNRIIFSGRYPAACDVKQWPIAYIDPQSYARRVLRAMWLQAGGKLDGRVREGSVPAGARMLGSSPSLPLWSVIADINKFSNNVMAQQLFLTLSSNRGDGSGSFEASRQVATQWWRQRWPTQPVPVMDNGSGLSRRERISANALTALLQTAATGPHAQPYLLSLGLAGVDGTVQRMKDRNPLSEALGNAQLKTGTLRDVAAIAGYVTGRSGQRYSVVAIVNHERASAARPALDGLVEWAIRD